MRNTIESSIENKVEESHLKHTITITEENTNEANTSRRDASFDKLWQDSHYVRDGIGNFWGVTLNSFNLDQEAPLSNKKPEALPDTVLISQSWNKALVYRWAFAQAMVGRWRMLVALNEFLQNDTMEQNQSDCSDDILRTPLAPTSIETQAMQMVESNADPMCKCFGPRIAGLNLLMCSAVDAAVRALCPQQICQREAHQPMKGSADSDPRVSRLFFHQDECITFEDYCFLFARYRVHPQFWLLFCDAFL